MKKELFFLLALAAAAVASPKDGRAAGTYHCAHQHKFDGDIYITQILAEDGSILSTRADWAQPGLLHERRDKDRSFEDFGFTTIVVDSIRSPAQHDPFWLDVSGAQITLRVVTRRRVRRASKITFHAPSRVSERYEPALGVSASSSTNVPWTSVEVPYRVLRALAAGEPVLNWNLLLYVGGDVEWASEEEGRLDLRKVEAFGRAVEAARPAVDVLRAQYRQRCRFEPSDNLLEGPEI